VRLVGQNPPEWKDRTHFMGLRRATYAPDLVDHARTHGAAKRGGNFRKLTLDEGLSNPNYRPGYSGLDEALNNLAQVNSQQCQIVELRFFSGLSIEDTSNF